MQKWSPEPFERATVPNPERSDAALGFATEAEQAGVGTAARGFRREAGFADRQTLMAALTPDERAQIFELVELDVARQYEERGRARAAEQAAELAATVAANDARLDAFAAEMQELVRRELAAVAEAAARLAVQLAGKIVRGQVAVDPEVLVRNLETILFRLESDQPLTVHVNPTDAAWLAERGDLREKLNLAAVTADRRVESGGAIVKAEGREWDATLGAQLESLNEIVVEMIATAGAVARNAEDADESGLD